MSTEETDIDFSFGVLTYNCNNYIVELLESIKYQILNYGCGKQIQLVIGDDCSKDRTVETIKNWLSRNPNLFTKHLILESIENQGTVANYNKVIHYIKSEYFHIIAGDDLYNLNDVFDYISRADQHDIITTFPLGLRDNGELFIDHNRLLRRFCDMKHKPFTKRELVSKEVYGSMFHTPSTFFRKELYTAEVESFVNNFVLFEDDPKWVRFLQSTDDVLFDSRPIVIYRYHDMSVSHSNSTRGIFRKDVLKLYKYYLGLDISLRYKIFAWLKYQDILHNRSRGISSLIRYIETIILNARYKNNKQFINLYKTIRDEKEISYEYYSKIRSVVKSY